jgi:hypothetical protein
MPRYVLEIGGRSIAVFDAPNPVRAAALVWSTSHLGPILRDTESNRLALWDGIEWLNYRPASPDEEQQGQTVHRQYNAEFGIDEDQGLFVYLVPIDGDRHKSFHCKDDWGMW